MNNDGEDPASMGAGLGKVFISYSHTDAPFVKKLNIRLRKAKFETWLYEKDVLVGDSVIDKVSEAIDDARAIVIVVSPFSITRPWLRYELARATDRMIQGKCRVLPVLIGSIEPPAMISHLLYADCRNSHRSGFAKVVRALEFEASRYPVVVPPSLTSSDPIERGRAVEGIISKVFNGHTFANYERSATRTVDYECYAIERTPDIDINVVFQDVLDFGNRKETLSKHDWDDFKEFVWDCGEEYALLVTHRPISEGLTKTLFRLSPKGVLYSVCKNVEYLDEPRVAVLLDVSDNHDSNAIRLALLHVRALFVAEAEKTKSRNSEKLLEDS